MASGDGGEFCQAQHPLGSQHVCISFSVQSCGREEGAGYLDSENGAINQCENTQKKYFLEYIMPVSPRNIHPRVLNRSPANVRPPQDFTLEIANAKPGCTEWKFFENGSFQRHNPHGQCHVALLSVPGIK